MTGIARRGSTVYYISCILLFIVYIILLADNMSQKTKQIARGILDSFGPVLPKDVEPKLLQLKSSGNVITTTTIVETVVVSKLCENQKGIFRSQDIHSIHNVLEVLKPHERDCFFNVICRLALVQTQGHVLNPLELSNQLLQKGYGCLGDVNVYGLIDECTEHHLLEYGTCNFIHVHVQHFLAAINLLKVPLMEICQFLKNYTLAEHDPIVAKNSSTVVQFFFGLASSIFGEGSTALLQNIIKYLTQYINRDAPIIDSKVSILILNCLYEAQNPSLYRQVQNETFTRQIFSFDIKVIEDNLEPFAYYLLHTSETRMAVWTIYCSSKQKSNINVLGKKITELKGTANVKTGTKLTATDQRRVVISNKNTEYLINVLSEIGLDSRESSIDGRERRDSSVSEASIGGRERSDSLVSEASSISSSTEHHITVPPDRLEDSSLMLSNKWSIPTDTSMLSEKLSIPASSISIHNFYDSVLITPMIPMHWVKVSYYIIINYLIIQGFTPRFQNLMVLLN